MYEKPELNRVGTAQDVILGFMPTGNDLDTYYIDSMMEFADDDEK